MPDDVLVQALTDLQHKVDSLAHKVSALERKWQWITSAAMLLVGAVGGPNAVSLITGHGG
jgi:hypothetical protein